MQYANNYDAADKDWEWEMITGKIKSTQILLKVPGERV